MSLRSPIVGVATLWFNGRRHNLLKGTPIMSNSNDIGANMSPAYYLGRERGVCAGSWVIDGNTSDATKRAIVKGYDEGAPEIMDMQPSPLSGEWADDPTIPDVLSELNEYERGYSDGFWDEVIRSAEPN